MAVIHEDEVLTRLSTVITATATAWREIVWSPARFVDVPDAFAGQCFALEVPTVLPGDRRRRVVGRDGTDGNRCTMQISIRLLQVLHVDDQVQAYRSAIRAEEAIREAVTLTDMSLTGPLIYQGTERRLDDSGLRLYSLLRYDVQPVVPFH